MSVRLEQAGSCLILHNRTEKRGAITVELYQAIQEACARADDGSVRSIILTGGAFFCAGGDLDLLARRAELPLDERRALIERLHDTIRAMMACPVPIIAAVEGGAAGAGLSITLACDFVVAVEQAQFTAAYVKAGLTPDGGLTHFLSRALPRQMMMELCLLARPISAERLANFGIVTTLVPKGQAFDQAQALAAELAQGPAQAQSRIRNLLNAAPNQTLSQQLDCEADFMAEAQGGTEAACGIRAFLEKRQPEFPT